MKAAAKSDFFTSAKTIPEAVPGSYGIPCDARRSRMAIWSRVTGASGQNIRLPQPLVIPACAIPSIGRRSREDNGTSRNMLAIGKTLPGEVPPPGAWLKTVSVALPAAATSAAEMATFSRVRET